MKENEPTPKPECEFDYFKCLFLDLPVCICIVEGRDYRFKMVNTAFDRLVGKKDYIGKPALDVFPEVGSQELISLLVKATNTGKVVEENEVKVRFYRDGDSVAEIYLNITLIPFRNTEGEFLGVIGIGVELKQDQTSKLS